MKLSKCVLGVIAVLFSIQPLASWAANSGQKQPTGGEKKIKISFPKKEAGEKPEDHQPICGKGGG